MARSFTSRSTRWSGNLPASPTLRRWTKMGTMSLIFGRRLRICRKLPRRRGGRWRSWRRTGAWRRTTSRGVWAGSRDPAEEAKERGERGEGSWWEDFRQQELGWAAWGRVSAWSCLTTTPCSTSPSPSRRRGRSRSTSRRAALATATWTLQRTATWAQTAARLAQQAKPHQILHLPTDESQAVVVLIL